MTKSFYNQSSYLECYRETKRQFPMASLHVLGDLAKRLYKSVRDEDIRVMALDEVHERYYELSTALSTVPNMCGIKPEDRRSNNGKDGG